MTQYGSNPHYYGSNYASGSGFLPSAPSAQYNFPSPSQYYGSIQQQGISNQFYNSTGFNPNSSYFQQAQSSGAYSQYPYNNNTTAYTLNATSGYFNNGSQGAYTQNINNSNASQNTTTMQQAIDSGSYESAAAANNASTSNPYGHYSTNFSAAFPGSATTASAAHNTNNQSNGSGPSYTMTTLNGNNNNNNNNNTVAYQGSNMLALSQTEQRRGSGIIPPKQIVVYRPSIHKSKQRYTVVA